MLNLKYFKLLDLSSQGFILNTVSKKKKKDAHKNNIDPKARISCFLFQLLFGCLGLNWTTFNLNARKIAYS